MKKLVIVNGEHPEAGSTLSPDSRQLAELMGEKLREQIDGCDSVAVICSPGNRVQEFAGVVCGYLNSQAKVVMGLEKSNYKDAIAVLKRERQQAELVIAIVHQAKSIYFNIIFSHFLLGKENPISNLPYGTAVVIDCESKESQLISCLA